MDRRMALKRGGGRKTASLDEAWMTSSSVVTPDGKYEAAVFRAKVTAAIRRVEREAEFADFAVFQMRVLECKPGKEVAESLGVSEPTVSRRLAKVRSMLRERLSEVIQTYSFTDEEIAEAERNGLALEPNKSDDAMFDEAISEIYRAETDAGRV
jgi:DNA-directed RNA polymerase specialized sigma24 family protein